jgi:cysteine desulfurase
LSAESDGKPIRIAVVGSGVAGIEITFCLRSFLRRAGIELESLVHGADHERGRRAGTESALLTGALGKACEFAGDLSKVSKIKSLRDRLWVGLSDNFGEGIVLNGHPDRRLPNTLNVSFVGRVGSEILDKLSVVAASTGSACHAGNVELSPVLKAMGISPEVGGGAIRFSLGRETTEEDINTVIDRLAFL